ncbi:amino acid adenylation domain-containing protein [Kordia sp. YSTF-M3]|uniref:Amino acid adenylation domain-containing protein n=1 Tax=Kordia aestuariivivens TaxID=2759037 RepID=A0ABR7QDG8_9FLAO|nr:non-ribosomal peptide synthetase [Kordia aestuariivivens]MBC8756558.1 amino acid adenylation domain-containing protein [Kordia aestuariivivens]
MNLIKTPPSAKSSKISLLTEDEYKKIVLDWNNTNVAYPSEKTIYQLFEEQVLKTPNSIAAVFEHEELTYAELNAKANQLARYLQSQTTIHSDTLITLCLDRSLDMIIAILGVQKAGAAYVPIDPGYPTERINYILEDTKTNLILTQSHLAEGLKKVSDVRLITLNTIPYKEEQSSNLVIQNTATDLAYVIYTSGTTGKPKGAVVTHQLLVNRLIWQKETYNFNESDTVLQKTPYVFDVSVWELLLPLISGSKLLFAKVNGHKEPEYLYKIIEGQKVTKLHFVPSMLTGFVAYLKNTNDNKLPFVKDVFCSGEALSIQLARDFKNLYPNIKLNNLYGPTEVAIDVSSYDDIQVNADLIPIGKPIQNIKFYVLDANKKAVPVGVEGELYIGAQNLSRGYLNRPELSAEKFISNPFASQAEIEKGYTHLYKTGDLVKWLPDGNIEYIGRNDFQVKIRGFRIELGEIENIINSIQGITQICVLAKERNERKYLAAYFTSETTILEEDILKIIAAQLPEYMLPSAFVQLESFPLTINGKLDRKALPEPEFTNEANYVAPSNDLETKLCSIWQEVLNLNKVGISDDFFRIGGDSILSIKLSSRLRKQGLNCSVGAIFDYRTIQQLAKFIVSDVDTVQIIAEQGNLEGEFNLLPIQQWFFNKIDAKQLPEFNHWNQSFLVKVPQLEVKKVQEIIQALTAQHDILRTNFNDTAQLYSSKISVPQLRRLNVEDLSKEKIEETLTNWQSHFDIQNGPLWSVAYIEGYEDKTARLYFALHHLIVDAVSWRILIEDFQSLYNNEILEGKTSSYRQWVHEISTYEEKHPTEKTYWDAILKTMPTYEVLEKKEAFGKIEISKKRTSDLLQQANKAYHTEVNDLLLTALSLTLQSWNEEATNFITLEGHGREQLNETIDHSKTIGWFTTMYPVELSNQENLESSIKWIKENLRAIPNKGIGFGAIYPNSYIKLPSITFNYLGQFDSQDGYWQVTSENSGAPIHIDNIEPDIINITGMVTDGQLNFSIISQLGETETTSFSSNFQKHLEDVIAHCLEKINNKETKHTPSDFETVTISQSLLDEIENDQQIEAIYLANSLQQGFVYHALSQKEDDAYRVQFLFDYKQALHVENYIKAWELVIEKYPILRTTFNWSEEIIQLVHRSAALNYEVLDISELSIDEKEEYIVKLQENDRKIAFDLKKPSLLRLYIIKQSETQYTLLKSEHHSILDGWSVPVLLNTVHEYYERLQKGNQIKITVDDSYGLAQRYYAKHRKNVDDFWYKKSLSIEQVNDLAPLLSSKQDLDTVKSLENPFDTAIEISGSEYQNLKKLTKTEGVTLNTLVQFAWHKLIQEYTQDHQTIVGTTVSGRDIPVSGIEESVGLYINTLPLIINWNNENTVLEQIQYLHQQITDINSHSFANLADLQKEGKRLFHSLFIFENDPMPTNEELGEDKLHPELRYAVEKLDYPIGITASEQNGKIVISLKSDRDILDVEQAKFNLSKLQLVLNQLTPNLHKKHTELSTITTEEYQQIVIDWNNTNVEYPKDKLIHELFEVQVLKTPGAIAVVFEKAALTYAELNAKANQLARYIRTQTEVNSDTLVAICLDRSLEMIISILGVLKSGAAYVPIDPEYPTERINYILKDTHTNLGLTRSHLTERLTESSRLKLIALDSISNQELDASNLPIQNNLNDLAYVIYTSGTTGNPKGVMIEHASVCNYMQTVATCFENIENIDYSSNFSFDLSVTTTIVPLLMGKRICIYGGKLTEINKYVKHLSDHKIDFIKSTPSFLTQIPFAEITHCVKSCFIGGEKSDANQLTYLNKYISNVYDEYGPTEATVGTTTILNVDGTNSIGKPYDNYKVYVLGKNSKPVPVGVVGELHIGGAGLARGYLNQAELTKEKFISNYFASQAEIKKGYTRLYKTGDTVKWLPSGNLEYIGRNDFQVKIRGYRIELGEIEHAINSIKGIKQACVLAREKNGNEYLVAYFVTDEMLTEEAILKHVSSQLPEYMIPSILVELDNFPLTINGKLDRKALPNTEFTNEDSYEAPSTDLEIRICKIWQEILKLDKVGVTDNFFRVGGNSILAIKLSHKIGKSLNILVVVADILKYKTISSLAKYLSTNTSAQLKIQTQNLERYPLSFAQERLWFIEQYEQGTNAYHIPLLVELEKDTDADRLKGAIQQVIQRHEILRTIFKQEDEHYIQVVIQDELVINEYLHENTNIEDQIVRDINTPFDLQNELPIRVSFYQQEDKVQLLITIHHIASDGWSEDILLKEIDAIYKGEVLPNLGIQYKDFSIWQREYLQGDLLKNQQDYWQEKLEGYEPLGMPTDKIRPKQIDYSGADVLFSLNAELSNKLRNLSKVQGCTMYTTLVSGFFILLNKYTSQDDIILGTPIANRHYSEIQDLIGFFVNSLALREELNQENTITELLSQVQNNLIEAQRSQDIPFEKIVETIGVAQDSSRHPIFQVMFGVQSFGGESACNLFKSLPLKDAYAIAKYDLSCFMDDGQEEIHGSFNFATSLYEEATITRMITHYQLVLEQMVNEQDTALKDYQLLTEAAYQQIVVDWNNTESAYPKDKTIHELFETQVLKTPENTALVYNDVQLSYQELNAKANQLAKYIQAQTEVTSDTLIALCLDRGIETMIGILGILKAGAAYVPIDPEYPAERINYILNDTKTNLILTQSHLVEKFKETKGVNLIEIDTVSYQELDASNLPIQNKSKDLAYVIYTSGTTGNPKGVMVEHTSVVSFAIENNFMDYSRVESVAGLSSFVFDGSIFDALVPLLSGKKYVMIAKNDVTNLDLLHDRFTQNNIDTVFFTTALFNSVVENKIEILSGLDQILFGGENSNDKNICTVKNKYPELSLLHVYGPTETVTYSTFCNLSQLKYDDVSPIGKGLNNKKHYILDKYLNICPIGVAGELHIGGAGIARGYLNQVELTAEKFIPNPFASQADKEKGYTRLYKTGDLVRLLPDGNIEYVGRNDFQVKIRGYRIELGEIENALNSIEGIKQCCVLAKERNGSKYLIAYFTSESKITEKAILKLLSAQLPDYMLPSILMELEKFPLTINGKFDRKALPEAEFINEDSYEAPSTDLEIKICEIWQEVLNLDKIGISDDFFRIGGDSILSIQLSSRLRKQGLNFSVRAIFDHRTISKLALFIAQDITTIEITAEQGNLEGEFDLLPVQKMFFDKKERNQLAKYNHWNQSFLVKVPELDANKLQEVIAKIVAQHDVLRIVFGDRNQRYQSEIEIAELTCLSIGNETEDEIAAKLTTLQSTFDIHKSPLWTIAYIDGYEHNSARLFFAFHHLIIDTVSWRILIEDFKSLYLGNALEKKSSSYRQWVNEISTYEEKHPTEKTYWEEILKRIVHAEVEEKQVQTSKTTLTKEQTSNLLQNANKAYHTEVNDLLLTALGLTLQNWNKEATNFITLEGHGREDVNETIDHSSTVGWFTTLYPVELKLEQDISSSIKSIKESLRTIPNKGIGFGAMYPKELINLPRISFNYLGQFDSQDEYWQVVSENSGIEIHADNTDTTLININGMVVAGKLSFQVDSKLGLEETEVFARNFEKYLSEVIEHCQAKIENNETKHTPSDFETVTISQNLLGQLEKDQQIEAIYPANSLQQGFVYHALSQKDDDAYRVQILFDYKQTLDIENYIKSWELAVEKHPILRTGFNWEEEILQIVYTEADLICEVSDNSHLSEEQQKQQIVDLQEADRKIAFDLRKPCLLRLHIIKQSDTHYTILKSEHHSISDGWSEPVLLNTVHENYEQLQQGKEVHVRIDNSYLEAQEYLFKEKHTIENYWCEKSQLIEQVNDLTPLLSCKQDLDVVKSLENPFDTAVEISGSQYQALKKLTKTEGLTLNTLVQFAWHKLIQEYTKDNQTIVGTTVSGRDIPVSGIEDSVGLYINTLPLIIDWENENTVLEQIQYLHQQITDINSHSFANLADLQKDEKRLFHSLLVFENYPMPEDKGQGEDKLRAEYKYAVEKLDYPIGIMAYEEGEKLIVTIKSDRAVLDAAQAEFNLSKLELLLNQLTPNLAKKHTELSTITAEEYKQIVVDWNNTESDYPKDKTIHELFEAQVLKTPENTAIVYDDVELSYQELNAKANQLAKYIQSQTEITSDTLIALCLDRGIETMIGIFGILKSGAAYVPIDPEYPAERINYILNDTKTDLILTQSHLVERFTETTDVSLIEIDTISYQELDDSNLPIQNQPNDLAYVIYTSGTTGNPKGVMVEHTSVVSFAIDNNFIDYSRVESVAGLSSFVFDGSIFDAFVPLLSGKKYVMIAKNDVTNLDLLYDRFTQNSIDTVFFTTALFNSVVENKIKILSGLDQILFGGENSNDKNICTVKSKYPELSLLHVYGPTETVTYSTFCKLSELAHDDISPIGKGLNNKKHYILDKNLNICPVGVAGELHIGGAGLARGYLNQVELTAEKFIPNPFANQSDEEKGYTRLYKTGDLVRLLPDGNIEYVGRNDFQVKIRGYRIELGEIENTLNSIQGIKQTCVLAKEKNDNKYLIAYYVSDGTITKEDILKLVSAQLPDYMIPSILMELEKFPLTINGKLDRKKLPEAEFTNEDSYEAPSTDLEIKVCEIWQDVLNLNKVGVTDNFFQIGGNSILAIKLSHRINKEFDASIEVTDVFKHKTVQELLERVSDMTEDEEEFIEMEL